MSELKPMVTSKKEEPERRVFENLVVLGNAVPDEISDNRKTVCTVAYSEKYGLIRIYPVPPVSPMKRWNVVTIPLERNPKDTRIESWKIQGSKSEWERISEKIKLTDTLKRPQWVELVEKLKKDFGHSCIDDLNQKKLSLGMITPTIDDMRLQKRKEQEKSLQTTLFGGEPFITIQNYDVQPRITYRCPTCVFQKPHDHQVLEWGVYEWLRHNSTDADAREKVWENLHIGESGYDTSFLVGNMALHRSNFMIISVFRYKK
ncbi:MAG: hypothetical protein ACREBB_07570 [Nitrosotalea sp.]